ncbi:hypothetical protein J6Q66_00790 [bacterium]|nr:hypothetical protein [bacterium]
MAIKNNIIKINRKDEQITSEYIEDELKKLGFLNILRGSIVEIKNDFIKINFSSY